MRTIRLASLLTAAVLLSACEKTGDSPGKGDTAVPYGGAGANGSIGSTPGYLNAAGADKAPAAAVPTGAPAAAGAAALTGLALPGGATIQVSASGIETQLVGFITDAAKPVDKTTWFEFDRLLFQTGSAVLEPSSSAQLSNIAAIMKAFPSVKLKIGGYTDNVGDSKKNLTLSSDRAKAAMAAIVAAGIDAGRLEAEGYGDTVPLADNSTEAGRAKNRRTAARVTAK
ncbi:MAG: OmpA family protein [Gemmatimonadaceae bacterium]|nr:OmpA family protein [Gemmatimonadaceae bacterium]